MAHVLAITNQKGGVGKTTTAINLGAALAEMGHYTLLGDLDPQGGLSLGLGLAAHDLDLTIYNILTDTRIPVAGITHHIRAHLDLLPSNIDLAVAEFQLIAQMGREYILREALATVRNTYEFIILDCPPSLNLLTVNALTAADAIVVPLQVEYFAMRGLEQLMDVISRVRRRLNPELEIIGIVPTMVDTRRLNDQQILLEVGKAYPGMLLDVNVKESIKFADAPRHQRSILELDPRHDGARSYRKLARIVLQHYGEWAEPEPFPEEPVPSNGSEGLPQWARALEAPAPAEAVAQLDVETPAAEASPTEAAAPPVLETAPTVESPDDVPAVTTELDADLTFATVDDLDPAAEPPVPPASGTNGATLDEMSSELDSAAPADLQQAEGELRSIPPS